MPKRILIIGEDPATVDFSAPGIPPGMSAQRVIAGLEASRDRLEADGHSAEILLTEPDATMPAQLRRALAIRYDVIVIGAGLRTVPAMTEKFEALINIVHTDAPGARLAFNTNPADSHSAANRWI